MSELQATSQETGTIRLTLEEARQQALANNNQLQLGNLNVQAAIHATEAARKDYFPKILGSAFYFHFDDDLGKVVTTRGREIGGGTGPLGLITLPTIQVPATSREASVVNQDAAFGMLLVAQPITKLIAVSANVDLHRAEQEIAAAQLDKGTRDLLSGVSQVYYGLLAARRIQSVLTLQANALEPLLKAKPDPKLRLASLEIRKGLVETDKQIAELSAQLCQLIGLPPCTVVELVEPVLAPIRVTCSGEAVDLALANNPQVREAQQSIVKAQAGLKVARMDYLPDVNVFGAYMGQSAADYMQDDFSAIGVSASYTFFDWGKRRNILRQRETQIALAAQNVTVTIETVRQEAHKAYLAYRQAEQNLEIATETAKANQELEAQAQDPATRMAAQAATAKAALEQMQAELAYRLAHAKLLAAIGNP
jgi:outer membrane protein TolC